MIIDWPSPNLQETASVLIIEDHPLFAHAMAELVMVARPGQHCECRTRLRTALERLKQQPAPRLIVLDLNLPDSPPELTLSRLLAGAPEVPILVVSAEPIRSLPGLNAGHPQVCFVPKSAEPTMLVRQLRQLLPEACPTIDTPVRAMPRLSLSDRQAQVLSEMATGKENKEIARSLGLSLDTVKAHVGEILSRLGVRNRTDAVRIFLTARKTNRHLGEEG